MWGKVMLYGKGWRTVVVNGFAVASATGSAIVAALASDTQDLNVVLGQFLTPARALGVISFLGLLNLILRVFTTGPVGTKD